MKTVNVDQYADPNVLREFSPRMLVALLDEDRPFLASKGVELPTIAEIQAANGEAVLDYAALAPVFKTMEDIPKGLVDRFHMVKAMSGPRQMDLILATVQERQLKFPLPLNHCSPEDIAAQLLLTHPKLFQELHAQAAVTRYRRFAYFVPRLKKSKFVLPDKMTGLEKTLNSWYEAHHRDRSARVGCRRHGEEYLFYVRHGEPVKREGAVGLKDCESESQIFRPERHGLVIYHATSGELRVHADSERELDLFRLAFGLHLFGDGNYFPESSHKFTLNPLKRGRKSLAWAGIPGLRGVTLVEIEILAGSGHLVRDKTKAPDVFAEFEARKFQIPEDAEIRLARFAALFEGQTKARPFTLEPSNFATFAKDGDGARMEPWLVRQGFAMTHRDEFLAEGHSGNLFRLESE